METWGAYADSKLLRVSFNHGNIPPTAVALATPASGPLPLKVHLSAAGSADPDGDTAALKHEWRLAGKSVATTAEADVTISDVGDQKIELIVTDSAGATVSTTTAVVAGNSQPVVTLSAPVNGSFFRPGEKIAWQAAVRDAEEGDSTKTPDLFGPRVLVTATLDRGGAEPPGLALMKSADCFNCHAPEHRIVGPAFLEVATKYRGVAGALEASVDRVQKGSSGVWGPVPMLPHGHHSREQIAQMVGWVYALKPGADQPQLQRGLSGEFTIPAEAAAARAVKIEATFTDAGQAPASPLTGHAAVTLRNHRIEGESFDEARGTQILGGNGASGDKFIGDTHHGQFLRFAGLDLAGKSRVTCRLASAGQGGFVEFHAGSPDGPLLAKMECPITGAWDSWREVSAPFSAQPTRADICVVFINPGKGGLMNLDWFQLD